MVIRDLRQKLAKKIGAMLLAGGVALPSAVIAAELNTNLVANPSFENVDPAVGGNYGSVKILDWQGAGSSGNGFAYNYGQGYDNRIGGFVPPGNDATSAEDYYFDGGSPDDGSLEGIFQDLDVSGGATGTAIAAGQAQYELSAFFSSYLTQGDFGNLSAEFFDGGGVSLGAVTISDTDTSQWSLESATGDVPATTSMVRVAAFGTAVSGAPDGYMDNVSFQITQVPEPSTFALAGLGMAGAASMLGRRRRKHAE